jgi:SAM-dependent methyltransferase
MKNGRLWPNMPIITSAMQPFEYDPSFRYESGWDQYALSYADLLQPDTIYQLTKDLAHEVVRHYMPDGQRKQVLDFNCGTGNDFPYFLSNGFHVTGVDGSKGMLNKAVEKHYSEWQSGQIVLCHMQSQSLDNHSFQPDQFDLIYSITGGFSYLSDDETRRVNEHLTRFLKPGGFMITGHLTPFSLGECWHYLRLGKMKMSLMRLKRTFSVPIKGETHTMYLRTVRQLKMLQPEPLRFCAAHPIMTTTPPYQTGYTPRKERLARHRKKELKRLFQPHYNAVADQVMLVMQKPF